MKKEFSETMIKVIKNIFRLKNFILFLPGCLSEKFVENKEEKKTTDKNKAKNKEKEKLDKDDL